MQSRVLALSLVFAACGEGAPRGVETQSPRDEFIYQVVVDRFANGDPQNDALEGATVDPSDLARHQGGDFAGLTEHLDYIAELGATTIWVSPIVANVPRSGPADGYHGYWASDFTRVNPRFGTEDEVRTFVDEAHARGIKVMLDVVINHTGQVFFYDANDNGRNDAGEAEPPFAEVYETVRFFAQPPRLWRKNGALESFALTGEHFHRRGQTVDFGSTLQLEQGDFPTGLRDLATTRDDVMQALVTTYAEWIRRTDVDGFRLDAAPHVSHADWARFCTGLRAEAAKLGKPAFLLLGEVFRGSPSDLASYTQPGEFDAVFDFTFKFDAIDRYLLEGGSPRYARSALEGARSAYPDAAQAGGIGVPPFAARVTFADNHDMARLRGRLDDERAAAVALTMLFTVDGVPAVYYGTEQGFSGTGGHGSRERLWDSGFDQDARPYRLIRQLATLRREHVALRRGELVVRYAAAMGGRGDEVESEDPTDPDEMQPPSGTTVRQNDTTLPADAGILAYERIHARERLLVVINATASRESRARMNTGFDPGTRLHDLLGDATFEVGAEGMLDVSIPRRAALVLGVR